MVFGPVPSRRLGLSLGVNNVYDKHCTYSCVYCQVGRTTNLSVRRREYYEPDALVDEVVRAVRERAPEVITFVPNGEPTLDANLGLEARGIKGKVFQPLAIMSNGSLLWREDVVEDLLLFDIVSVKVDTVRERTWRRLNRPHPTLRLDDVLEGIIHFSRRYSGNLISEHMLVEGLNSNREEAKDLASYLEEVSPRAAYITLPLRPPAEAWVKPPPRGVVEVFKEALSSSLGPDRVYVLGGLERGPPRVEGDPITEILKILEVHPLRMDQLEALCATMGLEPSSMLEELRGRGVNVEVFLGREFLVLRRRRSFPRSSRPSP